MGVGEHMNPIAKPLEGAEVDAGITRQRKRESVCVCVTEREYDVIFQQLPMHKHVHHQEMQHRTNYYGGPVV